MTKEPTLKPTPDVEAVARAIYYARYPDGDWEEWGQSRVWRDMAEAAILAHNAWRPIETAPKDGTLVLVFGRFRSSEFERPAVCYFDDETGNVWVLSELGTYFGEPTYWQPLPTPPGTAPKEDGLLSRVRELEEALKKIALGDVGEETVEPHSFYVLVRKMALEALNTTTPKSGGE